MFKNKLMSSLIIGLGFPLTQLAIVLYTPAFSVMAQYFGVGIDAMLMTFTILLSGYTVGTLFWGTVSDRIGRRRSLLFGLILYIAIASIIPLSKHYWEFCLALTIYGFVAATFTSVGNAMLRDIYGKEGIAQVVAFVGIAMATTPTIAPMIGAHLLHAFGWHALYIVVSIVGIFMLVGILCFVPAPKHPIRQQSSPLHHGIKAHLTNRNFMGYILCLGLVMGALTSTLEMLPVIYMHYLSLPVITFGYLGVVFMMPYPLGAIVSSRLVARIGARQVLLMGTLLGVIGALSLTLLAILGLKQIAFVSVMLGFVFLGFGLSLSMGKAGALSSVHEHVGSASSIMKFTQSLGGVMITFINAKVHQSQAITHFSLLILITLLLSTAIVKCIIKRVNY